MQVGEAEPRQYRTQSEREIVEHPLSIDPYGVLRQHHCLQRGTSAPDSKIIRRLLRLRQNASVFAQGCADFPSDSSDRDHSFTPDQDKSVSGQRCADLPASSADRSHYFKSDPWRTSSPLHPNLGFRYPQSPLVARTSVTDVTRQPAAAIALQYSRSLLSLERQTRAVVRPGMRKMVRRGAFRYVSSHASNRQFAYQPPPDGTS